MKHRLLRPRLWEEARNLKSCCHQNGNICRKIKRQSLPQRHIGHVDCEGGSGCKGYGVSMYFDEVFLASARSAALCFPFDFDIRGMKSLRSCLRRRFFVDVDSEVGESDIVGLDTAFDVEAYAIEAWGTGRNPSSPVDTACSPSGSVAVDMGPLSAGTNKTSGSLSIFSCVSGPISGFFSPHPKYRIPRMTSGKKKITAIMINTTSAKYRYPKIKAASDPKNSSGESRRHVCDENSQMLPITNQTIENTPMMSVKN